MTSVEVTDGDRRGARKRPETELLRSNIAIAALEQMLNEDAPDLTVKSVSESLGVSFWSVYRQYQSRDALLRAAIETMLDELAAQASLSSPSARSVAGAIAYAVKQTSDLMLTHRYRQLMLILIRHGRAQPWMEPLYQQGLVAVLATRFDAAIRRAGATLEMLVGVRPSECVRVVRLLEHALVMSRLLPGADQLTDSQITAACRTAVDSLVEATYVVDFEETAAA